MQLTTTNISTWGFLFSSAIAAQCNVGPELLWLQDGSASLESTRKDIATSLPSIFDTLSKKFTMVRIGTSMFSDKPMPFRGVGKRHYIPDLDRCYIPQSPLSTDMVSVGKALADAPGLGGGDFPENPYEAILGAILDPNMGWTQSSQYPNGTKPFRVIAVSTDDVPHYEGDALTGITFFNTDRNPPPSESPKRNGGFGHPDLIRRPTAFNSGYILDSTRYGRMCDLWYKNDTTPLAKDEANELNDLIEEWGPSSWPAPQSHTGTYEAVLNCWNYEYPSLDLVGRKLRELNATVLMFLAAPQQVSPDSYNECVARGYPISAARTTSDILGCAQAIYKADFEAMGINAVITVFEGPDDIHTALDTALAYAPEYDCPDPTVSTTVSPRSQSTKSDSGSSTRNAGSSTAYASDTESTGHSKGGSNAGTIAGASGGAVAGVAALGGLAYKKFGSFAKSPSANPTIETNEEVPDTPLERESMEEVTMDMFQ